MRATLIAGCLAGGMATWTKSQAEGTLQPLAERLLPPSAPQRVELGADPAGHPENMPPAEVADRVVHAATGGRLTDAQRQRVSPPIHWTMGVGSGAVYALLARRWPAVGAGHGVVAGAALFAATHGSTLPLAGVQDPPGRLPRAWWVWEGGSHLVYGVVLATAYRVLRFVT